MENNTIWNSFTEKIQKEVEPMLYQTWFGDLKILSIDDKTVKIIVPMQIHKKRLTDFYNELVKNTFYEILGYPVEIEYITGDDSIKNISFGNNPVEKTTKKQYETNLNPRYTFDNFVRGESNKFARDNAFLIAQQPGKLYNPLFVYGNSGVGKSHLLNAIGNYIVEHSDLNVLYAPSDKFVNDFLNIYRTNKDNNVSNFDLIDDFKRKYHDVDVLIIDDIQYLEIASKTQQEFFNTFNELYNNNKQIIISSDRSPEDLKKLEVRLRTRFTSGLSLDILPPDFELRLNIINNKIKENEMNVDFPEDVKNYIASNCESNVRRLEGAITRVFAYATIMNGSIIDLELAQEALKDYFTKSIISKNKIDQVIQLVSNAYNVSVDDIKGKKRQAKIVLPRQVAMFICHDYLDEPYQRIGTEFGGKDHTTVMYAIDKIKIEMSKNRTLNDMIQKIISQIK